MHRLVIITITLLCATLVHADKSAYQIDLIIFAHQQVANHSNALDLNSPLLPIAQNAIVLAADGTKSYKPYKLIPASQSSLRNEYYLLSRKSNYQVLGQYSWRQTLTNQNTVALPLSTHNGWQVQGTFQVKQGTYYFFDANLQFSPPSNPDSSFTVTQKQRLKGNLVYYLDHPQIGMVVKIHKLT